MSDILQQYLGVVPFDLAQSSNFNIYDWARNKVIYDLGYDIQLSQAPEYNLKGDKITQQDINQYLEMAKAEWENLQNNEVQR